ncbi:ankyrin repeat domain-containing protein [Leekyejoonella antrihumi]|uniref:Ankyrin repeat domain-containing protein n=1 Tax=Leekyejoonella antrihumi TaxID=1660198 RepID=A0A563DVH1_9MICO|nr:ankyrin repeat domain-containing protein [Leekyejoonella antrihumi]TWP34185.1 ankyrin repeat domain-containing protein [Leekyejoonella antrihumi]
MTDEPSAHDAQLIKVAQACLDFARDGDTARICAYADRGVPVDLADSRGNTLLMLAAYHGHTDTVCGLIERGAEVNRPNDRGQTPVAGAIFKGEDDVVRALVAAGADLEAGSPTGRATASMFGREDLLS